MPQKLMAETRNIISNQDVSSRRNEENRPWWHKVRSKGLDSSLSLVWMAGYGFNSRVSAVSIGRLWYLLVQHCVADNENIAHLMGVFRNRGHAPNKVSHGAHQDSFSESVKVVQRKLVQVILEFEESYVVKEACLLIAFPLYTWSNG